MSAAAKLYASDRAAELHASAVEALDGGLLDEALQLVVEATAQFIAASGVDHPDVASCDLVRARIARAAGAYDDALDFVDGAIDALEASREEYPDEPVLVVMRAGAASVRCAVLVSLGRYDDAERAVAAVLPLVLATCGEDHEIVADLRNALGICHKYQSRWDEAAAQYARAYATLVAIHGAGSPALASLEHNLGGLAHARGEAALAEPHARRAVELRRLAVGDDHPDVAADLAAWAAILDDLGRIDDAAVAYSEALAIFHATLGPDHHEVGLTRAALGALYAGACRWNDARHELTAALAIQEAALGEQHPDVALVHHYLSVVEHARGALFAAAAHATRAAAVFARIFPADHPRVVDSRVTADAIAAALG